MTEEQQFKAFKRFTKGKIVLSGDIQLVLRDKLYDKPEEEMSYKKDVVFDVHVSEDSSYTESGIDYGIWETLHTFEKLIGEDVGFDFKYEFHDLPKNNLGSKFKQKVDDVFKTINEIYMGNNPKITMLVKHVKSGFSLEMGGESSFTDRLVITNYVKVEKAFEDGSETSLKSGIDLYEWYLIRRPYDDSDNNYLAIDRLLDEFKGITSENLIAYVLTEFV
jgi:hypothetical protein